MRSASALVRYSVAVLVACAALLLRFALEPVIGNAARYSFFVLGVIVSAWFGGFFPGILTTALLLGGGGYLGPQPGIVIPASSTRIIAPAAFIVTALACCTVIEALRRARQSSALSAALARETESRLRSVLEGSQEAIFALDKDFCFTFANQRTAAIGRKPLHELIGENLWNLFPDSRHQITWDELDRAMRDRVPVSFEAPYPSLDIWFECDAFPADDGGLNVFVRDVSGRKLAQTEAGREHQRLEAIVQQLPAGVMITSAEGVVEMINPAANEIFGVTLRAGDPLGGDDWPVTRALRTGELVSNFEIRFDRHGRDATLVANALPLRNEKGEVESVLGAFFDVTPLRQTETALRETEKRLRRLFESPLIGVLSGENNLILDANDAFLSLLGYTRSDLPLDWNAITPAAFAERDAAAIQEMCERGYCTPYEKEYLGRSGRSVPMMVGVTAFEKGSWSPWIGWALDLTERRRLEERLRQAAKLESVGLLAGGVAHDFNNLLTGVLGNATLAFDTIPQANPARPLLESVIKATERAADLTRQLLAYAGKGRFIVQPVDVSDLIREIAQLIRTSIPRSVQVEVDLAPDLPPVEADATQLQQLVMNLVINGAEAIGERNGSVRITTARQNVDEAWLRTSDVAGEIGPGEYVHIEVQDTGCGMDADTRKRIFDPFFTTKFTGRGLGLAAVLGIVRGHKGAIKVYSAPGRGSTFKIILPAAQAARPAKPAVAETPPLGGSGTILVVDDEEVVRRTAKSALQRYGYTVVTAENGREAIDIFRGMIGRISMILLDMTMPVMGGEEALRTLKTIDPGVKVLLSSGFNEVEAIRRFTGKGLAGFIQKPYTAAALADKVRLVLESSSSSVATT